MEVDPNLEGRERELQSGAEHDRQEADTTPSTASPVSDAITHGHRFGDTNVNGYRPLVIQGDVHGDVYGTIYLLCHAGSHRFVSPGRVVGIDGAFLRVPTEEGNGSQQRLTGHRSEPPNNSFTGASGQELWCEELKLLVKGVRLIIGARFNNDNNNNIEDTCEDCGSRLGPCHVLIESLSTPLGSRTMRRLKIVGPRSRILWLPETRIGFRTDGTRVTFKFSNCNRLNPVTAENGILRTVAEYNPEDPNVQVTIDFQEAADAERFAGCILYRDNASAFERCKFVLPSPDRHQDGIRLWMRESRPHVIYEEYDEITFTDRFDFVVKESDDSVHFRYINWLRHYPAQHTQDLPQYVVQTLDGGPTRVAMEGGHLRSSTLRMPIDMEKLQDTLNTLLTGVSDWKFQLVIPRMKLKLSGSESICQLTVWTCNDYVKVLTRELDEQEPKNCHSPLYWSAISLQKHKSCCRANKEDNNNNIRLVLSSIECRRGTYLETKELEPTCEGEGSLKKNKKNIEIELQFERADWELFRREVSKEFLPLKGED